MRTLLLASCLLAACQDDTVPSSVPPAAPVDMLGLDAMVDAYPDHGPPDRGLPDRTIDAAPDATPSRWQCGPGGNYDEATVWLQMLVEADQSERAGARDFGPDEWAELSARDAMRRAEVAELAEAGCLQSAADYAAAALIYQHGVIPDDFWLAHQYAMRALELGDERQRRLAGLAVDRFLVNSGFQQLFASQAYRFEDDPCWCLQPYLEAFDDAIRVEWVGRDLAGALRWVDSLNQGLDCAAARVCEQDLAAPERGMIPGIW
jgi:hypothetical protein